MVVAILIPTPIVQRLSNPLNSFDSNIMIGNPCVERCSLARETIMNSFLIQIKRMMRAGLSNTPCMVSTIPNTPLDPPISLEWAEACGDIPFALEGEAHIWKAKTTISQISCVYFPLPSRLQITLGKHQSILERNVLYCSWQTASMDDPERCLTQPVGEDDWMVH